jgi:hypothetical protein
MEGLEFAQDTTLSDNGIYEVSEAERNRANLTKQLGGEY